MPNTASATIGGKIGPGNTLTAYSFSNVTNINFNIVRGIIYVQFGNNQSQYLDYNQTATVTFSISGTVTTITIT